MFEHVGSWGTPVQKRWFSWHGLETKSKENGQPVICLDCRAEIPTYKAFVEHACETGRTAGRLFGVAKPAQPCLPGVQV